MKESAPQPSRSPERAHDAAAEGAPSETVIDDPGLLERRLSDIARAKDALLGHQSRHAAESHARKGIRMRLGLPPESESVHSDPSAQRERLERELARIEANYPGDWTLALRERLLHPSSREKMMALYERYADSFGEGEIGFLDKDRDFRAYQQRHAVEFMQRVSEQFLVTEYGPASGFGSLPQSLGVAKRTGRTYEERFSHPGAVFSDAIASGKPLTSRQKNIIEAHEKGHAVREFSGALGKEVIDALDLEALKAHAKNFNYSAEPDEIVERMAQLKNYFGFTDDEPFTRAHLERARERYLADTGLDNSMTELFAAITPEKEEDFLRVMNTYPI